MAKAAKAAKAGGGERRSGREELCCCFRWTPGEASGQGGAREKTAKAPPPPPFGAIRCPVPTGAGSAFYRTSRIVRKFESYREYRRSRDRHRVGEVKGERARRTEPASCRHPDRAAMGPHCRPHCRPACRRARSYLPHYQHHFIHSSTLCFCGTCGEAGRCAGQGAQAGGPTPAERRGKEGGSEIAPPEYVQQQEMLPVLFVVLGPNIQC